MFTRMRKCSIQDRLGEANRLLEVSSIYLGAYYAVAGEMIREERKLKA